MTDTRPHTVLDVPYEPRDESGATTIGGYLTALLDRVWRDEQTFDGKRPFGASGWQGDVLDALAAHGLLKTDPDETEYTAYAPGEADTGHALVHAAIRGLYTPTVWHRYRYRDRATAPAHENHVWIHETHRHGVTIGYWDGWAFRLAGGSDDCVVSHWAEITEPAPPADYVKGEEYEGDEE